MDPLKVAGAFGEAVDPFLIDGQPVGHADFLIHVVEKIGQSQRHGRSHPIDVAGGLPRAWPASGHNGLVELVLITVAS
jgi:hypothetical protein